MESPISLFSFNNYKDYLLNILSDKNLNLTRSSIAEAIGCQPSFMSQVLNKDMHLSESQAIKLSNYLGYTELEASYFVLLVLFQKAELKELKSIYYQSLEFKRSEYKKIANRIGIKTSLDDLFYLEYFSSWHFAAIYTLLIEPQEWKVEMIAQRLQIETSRVQYIINFFEKHKLIEKTDDHYKPTSIRIHLDKQSPFINLHHKNWRHKVIDNLDNTTNRSNLNYSSVLTISKEDAKKIEEIVLKSIQEVESVVKTTGEGHLCSFCVDFISI